MVTGANSFSYLGKRALVLPKLNCSLHWTFEVNGLSIKFIKKSDRLMNEEIKQICKITVDSRWCVCARPWCNSFNFFVCFSKSNWFFIIKCWEVGNNVPIKKGNHF